MTSHHIEFGFIAGYLIIVSCRPIIIKLRKRDELSQA